MNAKSNGQSRIEYFDLARGIAILCVILAHFPVLEIPGLLSRACFSFHMPLFFLISGYFFRDKLFSDFLSSKSKQLLIPYLICLIGIIGSSVLWSVYLQREESIEQSILNWIWAGLYGSGMLYTEPFWIEAIGAIWFLPALFWALLLLYFCLRRKNPLIWIVIAILIGFYTKKYFWLPLSIQSSLICVVYLYIGYRFKQKDVLNRIFVRPFWAAAVFLLWAVYLAVGGGKLYLVRGYFGLGLLYDLFFSVIASVAVLYLCWRISGLKWKIKNVLLFWGRNFLKVLCIHVIELNTFPWDQVKFFLENRGISGYVLTAALYGIKLLLIAAAVVLINKTEEKWRLRKENKTDELICAEKASCACGGLLSFSRKEYLLAGIIWIALVIADLPLPESVRQISCSYFVPFAFVVAGCISGKKLAERKYWEFGKVLLGGYAACRIGYLAVQLWQSVLYSSGSDSGVILRDWFTVSIWGLSNSSKILASVGNVGVLWILPCLLCCGIFTAVLIRSNSMVFQIAAAAIAGMVGIYLGQKGLFLPFSLDAALAGMPLFLAGYLGYQNKDQLRKPMLQGGIVFFSVCWLVLARWKGIDLAARMYPLGILSVICAASVGLLSLILIDDCSLPDTVQSGLEWAGKHGIMLLGIHCAVQRLAPWNSAAAAASVGGQLLIEAAIIIPTGILLILITRWIHNLENKRDWVTDLYLVVLTLYFVRAFFDTTMFRFPWPVSFYPVIRVLMLVVAWKKIMQMQEWKQLVACCAAALVFCFSFMTTGYEFLFDLGILLIGAVGVPSRKILKIYLAGLVITMYVALVGSFTGVIADLVYRDGDFYKHSFGICYPTDFAAHLVYGVLVFWVLFRKIPTIVHVAIMVGLTVLQLMFCGTQCSEIVMVLSMISVIYVAASGWIMQRNGVVGKIIRGIDWLVCTTTVVCAVVIVVLSMRYDPNVLIMEWLNQALSGRLRLAQDAFQQYGMSLFGTAFEMVGNGGDTVSRAGYNFVDSSFCLILVRYGILAFLAILVLTVFIGVKANKNGNRRVVFALALIAVHSMIEHHLIELAYNPFLLLIFCDMRDMCVQNRKRNAPVALEKKVKLLYGVVYGGVVLFLLWGTPAILTYGRTLVTLLRLYEVNRQWWFIFALVVLTAAVVLLIRQIAFGMDCFRCRSNRNKRRGYLAVVCMMILISSFAAGEWTLKRFGCSYEESVKRGIELIEILQEKLDGQDYRIYVDDVPALYQRHVKGVSNSIFTASGVAEKKNIIIVTDKSKDIFELTEAGFQFGELSEQEGIYTNNEKAIQALEQNGISMEKCYSVRKIVNLENMAVLNDLEMTESGGLLVDSQEKSLIYGPYAVVYKGVLEVTFQLTFLDSSIQEGKVATVRLSSDCGKRVLEEKILNRDDFNEDDECIVTIKKTINSSEGIEFLIFSNGDTKLAVQSITYKKVEE